MKKPFVFFVLLMATLPSAISQLSITGYASGEAYLGVNFSKPNSKKLPDFYYNHTKLNSSQLNLIEFSLILNSNRIHSQVTLADGVYMRNNYQGEQGAMKHIKDAYMEYYITENKYWSVASGVFPSHIGYESAAASGNLLLTRSLMAENSPYYESGTRIRYNNADEKQTVGLYLLSGWQNSRWLKQFIQPALGWELGWKMGRKLECHYNGYTTLSNEIKPKRQYHNTYFQLPINQHHSATLDFDLGYNQKKGQALQSWRSVSLVHQYQLTSSLTSALRIEKMWDSPNPVVLQDGNQTFISASSASLGFSFRHLRISGAEVIELHLSSWIWRVELKYLYETKLKKNDTVSHVHPWLGFVSLAYSPNYFSFYQRYHPRY